MLDFSSSCSKDWPQGYILRAQSEEFFKVLVCIGNTLFIRLLFSFTLRNTCLTITEFNARCIFSWVIDKRTTYVSQGNIKLTQTDLPVFNKLQRVVFVVILPFELHQDNCYPFKQIGGYSSTMCLWKRNLKADCGLFMGVHKYMIKSIA